MRDSSAAKRSQPNPAETGRIDDRYRVERLLGRGGMGEVLAVVEEATGKRFALKRLLPGAKPRHAMLLSREFHTLASLKHPHVVQAFDYGTDAGVPYYTMELLQGADVEALAPLPWAEVVPILRDVASALALIHARHLVHRDVGARNVWRTREGVVKLIDFGALTSFGASHDIAGTAPYVAPEALRERVLDQRTDLYSLGALAYVLLTGTHAYSARSLSELEQHWAEGMSAPNARLATLGRTDLAVVPERLEQLVEALLALAPSSRPSSAAEVLDRLELVLPGQSDVAEVALEGVLASKAFVGRANEKQRLRALLKRTQSQLGASVALLGPEGVGRSRLLAEFAMEARLAGAHVISVAGDADRSLLAAAARAALKLLETVPAVARLCAAPHAPVLGHLSPELRSALGIAPEALERFPDTAGEKRMRIQSALHSFWLEVSSKKPIVLLIDDLQDMDEASSALFTTLARDAAAAQLLVAAAVRTEYDATVPAQAEAFVEKAVVLGLSGLLLDDCTSMLRSIFGDVEHLARTAQLLGERAEGNPGRLMQLCEYLVRSDKIRGIGGTWILPQEAAELATPGSLAELDRARFARLDTDARTLARALSVLDAAIPLELCSALSPLPAQRLFAALSALCASGVLVQNEQGYAFRRGELRVLLRSELDPDESVRANASAGNALLALEAPTLLERIGAGLHLLRGGEGLKGAEILHVAVGELMENAPEERAEIAARLEQAIGPMRKLGLREDELLSTLCALAWSGYFVDRRLGFAYGDEALASAQRVCGMDLARRLSPWLGKKLGLYVALIVSGVRLRRRGRASPLVPDLALALRLLLTAAASLAGMYALCIERPKVRAAARAIEPLAALGPDHVANVVYQFAFGCIGAVSDRLGETRRHWERLLARLDDPRPIKGLSETQRDYYRAAAMLTWGTSECWRDKSRALEIAERLERQPLKLYQVGADQTRAVYYAHQGNMREAAHHKARVETRALQRGMTWQVELWEPSASSAIGVRHLDAMTVKRAAGQLSHLSQETPSLGVYVEGARASYLLLRGRYLEALPLLESLLERRDPELIGHSNLVALLAHAYNRLERFGDAERVAKSALARLTPDDLAIPAMTLPVQIELAAAESGLGAHEAAAARLDALIAQHAPHEGPLTLGALHDARAGVALRAHQEPVARHHVEQMERWYRSTDSPSLIQHCDRVAKRWAKSRARRGDVPFLPGMSFLATVGSRLTSAISDAPEELLAQLVQGAMAAEGALFYSAGEGLPLMYKTRAGALPEGLCPWVEQRMSSALVYTTETEDSGTPELNDPNLIQFEEKSWRLFLLVADQGSSDRVVGAIALCNPVTQVPLDVLRALARHLHGDPQRGLTSQWSQD